MRYSFDNFINHILLFPVAVSRLAVCGCSVERAGSTRFESLNVWRFENLNIWKTFLHTQNIALNSPKFKTKSKNFCQRYFWKKVCLNSHIMLTECCLSPKILTRYMLSSSTTNAIMQGHPCGPEWSKYSSFPPNDFHNFQWANCPNSNGRLP